jgi:localization factor PodJL
MTQSAPWTVRGVGPDVRDVASEAARLSGMSVGRWLDTVIRDNAAELGVDDQPRRGRLPQRRSRLRPVDDTYEDPLDAVAERIERLGRGERATAARAQPESASEARIAGLIDAAMDAMERQARQTEEKTAGVLQGIERLLQRSDDGRQHEAKVQANARDNQTSALNATLGQLASRLADIERHVIEPARKAPAEEADRTLKTLEAKLAGIARKLDTAVETTPKLDAQAGERTEAALRAMEARIAALTGKLDERSADKRGRADAERIEQALRDMQGRLEQLGKRIAEPQPVPAAPASAAIEKKLASILDALNQQTRAPEPAPAPRAPAAQPSQRPATPAPSRQRPTVDNRRSLLAHDLRGAIAEIAERQRDLDGALSDGESIDPQALDAMRREIGILSDRMAALGDGVKAHDFADLRHDIAGLTRGMEALMRRAIDPDLGALRGDLQAISQAVAGLAPREQLQQVELAVRDLAGKLAQSREEGVRAGQLAPIERLVTDLRTSVDALKEPPALKELSRTISALAHRVEGQHARSAHEPDPALGQLQAETSEIRAILSRAPSADALDGLTRQIDKLTDRLDSLAARPDDISASTGVADAVMRVRSILEQARPAEMLARLEARIDELGARLEARASQQDSRLIEDLGERIDALTQRLEVGPGPAAGMGEAERLVAGLADRIDDVARRIDASSSGTDERMFAAVSERLERMHRMLESRPAQGGSPELESMVRTLMDRMAGEGMRPGAEPNEATLDALQGDITRLARHLERADDKLASIDEIAQAMGGLMRRVDQVQSTTSQAAEQAVRNALADMLPAMGTPAGGTADLRDDIDDIKHAQREAERRTAETLGVVHGTLEKVVQKLAQLERGVPATPAPAAAAPVSAEVMEAEPAPRRAAAEPPRNAIASAIQAARSAVAPETRVSAADRPAPTVRPGEKATAGKAAAEAATISPPLDLPLEPGSGRPAGGPAGDVVSDENLDPKAAFIAKVRRAQAAAQQAQAAAETQARPGAFAAVAERAAGLKRKHVVLLGLAALMVAGVALIVGSGWLGGGPRPVAAVPAERPAIAAPARPAAPSASAPVARSTVPADPQTVATVPARPPQEATTGEAPRSEPRPEARRIEGFPAPGGSGFPSRVAAEPPSSAVTLAAPAAVASLPAAGAVASGDALARFEGLQPAERLRAAALAGDPQAQFEVGARYGEGRLATRDLALALRWFEKAAAQGHAPAQYRAGGLHREGKGVKQNAPQALALFRLAAEQGHVRAMHNLAVMLAEGANGAPDYAGAAQWFRKAADHGIKDSQFNLAILHARGLGVPQDLAQSYLWFDAASKHGDPDAAKKRDEVGARMSPEQLAQARQLAASWRQLTPDPAANEATTPPGGWDAAARPAAPAAPKAKPPRSA